jgi:hypothetical protein
VSNYDCECSEYRNLNKQAFQDDILARFHIVSSAHNASTAGLDDERCDVSANKDLGEPSYGGDGVRLGMDGSNESSKHHVHKRCKRWCEEDRYILDHIWHQLIGLVSGSASSAVFNMLDCGVVLLAPIRMKRMLV